MGGDGQLFAGKVELVTEDNQRWSARLAYAKVNPENQSINKAFPRSDTLKGVQLGWSGDVYKSVRLNTSLWYTDATIMIAMMWVQARGLKSHLIYSLNTASGNRLLFGD
jgi:hypothetical protein